jgi:hypothetical protein
MVWYMTVPQFLFSVHLLFGAALAVRFLYRQRGGLIKRGIIFEMVIGITVVSNVVYVYIFLKF